MVHTRCLLTWEGGISLKSILVILVISIILVLGYVSISNSQTNAQISYSQPAIDDELMDLFRHKSPIYVTIVLKYEFENNYNSEYLKLRESQVKNQVDSFLSNLGNGFIINRRSSLIPSISGYLSVQGFEQIKNKNNILSIYQPGKAKLLLTESTKLIQVNKANSLILNGDNITGKNQTICVIDTGVNYTHPDLGGCLGNGCKVVSGYDFCSTRDIFGSN